MTSRYRQHGNADVGLELIGTDGQARQISEHFEDLANGATPWIGAAVGGASVDFTDGQTGGVHRTLLDKGGDLLGTPDFADDPTAMSSNGTQYVVGTCTVSVASSVGSKSLIFLGAAKLVADGVAVSLPNLETIIAGGNTVRFDTANGGSWTIGGNRLGHVNPYWFSSGDLGAGLNAGIASGCRNFMIPAIDNQTWSTPVDGVDYLTLTTLPAQRYTAISVSTTAGYPMLDLSGRQGYVVDGLTLNGASTSTPTLAFLVARRTSGGNDYARGVIRNCHVRGSWGICIRMNCAGETCYEEGNRFYLNDHGDHASVQTTLNSVTLPRAAGIICSKHCYTDDISPVSGTLDTSYQSTSAIEWRNQVEAYLADSSLTAGSTIAILGKVEDVQWSPNYVATLGRCTAYFAPLDTSQMSQRSINLNVRGRSEVNSGTGSVPFIIAERGPVDSVAGTSLFSLENWTLAPSSILAQTLTAGIAIIKFGQYVNTKGGRFQAPYTSSAYYDTFIDWSATGCFLDRTHFYEHSGIKFTGGSNYAAGCWFWVPQAASGQFAFSGNKNGCVIFRRTTDGLTHVLNLGTATVGTVLQMPIMTGRPATANPEAGMICLYKPSTTLYLSVYDGSAWNDLTIA